MAGETPKFMGTYFDQDSVIKMARIFRILSWVTAAIYAVDFILSFGVFLLQYFRGFMAGMGFTDLATQWLYLLERPLHGIIYFAVLQALAKGLLVLLDLEENTRRAARR